MNVNRITSINSSPNAQDDILVTTETYRGRHYFIKKVTFMKSYSWFAFYIESPEKHLNSLKGEITFYGQIALDDTILPHNYIGFDTSESAFHHWHVSVGDCIDRSKTIIDEMLEA